MARAPSDPQAVAWRLRNLPVAVATGIEVPVARTVLARTLGLAWLEQDMAGDGLLIPGCRSVHTFGMRFEVDIFFLGRDGQVVRVCRGVRSGRCLFSGRARSVLELVPCRYRGERVAPPAA